jgi:hypothetical protein
MDNMDKEKLLKEVSSHYDAWTKDVEQRMTRKFGWNDITDAYYGKLPDDWPFTSRTTDPRIRTVLIEKNARLTNGKLRGRLAPREGADIIGARINNALLDYQWDRANDGGSMQVKISISDMDTRLYQSKFALCDWKVERDADGKITFEGNEFTPLDIRDCGMDFNATHIKNSKWFQYRTWSYIEDLERQLDVDGKPLFENLREIKDLMLKGDGETTKSDKKTEYSSHIKELQGLEDRVGTDIAFPVLEVVTERRDDIWITFSPKYNKILRVIDNPYELKNKRVAQLRYYPLQDDPLGESEVENVIPLWRAIQATLCGYMDEVILKMRPPLKIIEGAARLETIVYSPEAQWLMNRPDAVTEMTSSGQAVEYFQQTYTALVSAFNTAMGTFSQGVSNINLTQPNKTATEINASAAQQNARDEKNQTDLAEFIKDIMMFWVANNKQFLFSDPEKKEYVLRIIGKENFAYFQQAGLDAYDLQPEAAQMISDILQQNPDTSEAELMQLVSAGSLPRYKVQANPEEKNPDKFEFKPKMSISDTGDVADLTMVPEDLDGTFDYIPDIKSMRMGSVQERANAVNQAISLNLNPNVIQLLQAEGYRTKIKELLSESYDNSGINDPERFFEKINVNPTFQGQNTGPQEGNPQMGGPQPNSQNPGLSGIPQADIGAGPNQQMA